MNRKRLLLTVRSQTCTLKKVTLCPQRFSYNFKKQTRYPKQKVSFRNCPLPKYGTVPYLWLEFVMVLNAVLLRSFFRHHVLGRYGTVPFLMTKFMPFTIVNRIAFVNFPIWPGPFYWLMYSSFSEVPSSNWIYTRTFSSMNWIKTCKLPSAIL